MADTKASAEPKKRRTFPHETTQGGCDSRTESPSSDRSTADATHSSTPEPAQTHTAQTTPGASIVQPLVGPVPAADEESGDALDSECDEEEEEMMFDYVSASEDTTPPLPSEITESDDSPDESSPAVVADNDALMNEDTDFDWPILESEELLDFAKDEAELAKTRKTGWYLDPDEFPPDQRYPGLYDDPYGPSEEVMRLEVYYGREQHTQEVCSNRKRSVGERQATKYYCPGCSLSDEASKVWPHTKTNTLTCHQIWHFQWNNGTNRPRPRCGRNIQRHKASSGAGKRKRHRRSLSGQDNDNAAETTEREDTADEHAAEDTAADQHADEE
ncbi:hypothetical protein PC113_g11085 [Phytophthora cactorum]|uniref:Uncharacterized protein n=1 Tax=Phytophthora cactorum TaxID=29920 RepID=A0A8T0Z3X6_9STRA|nr:hypothetical protein PC113_g11085 [Phytophthora cactorum]